MPATFRIDPATHVIYSRGWGVLTDEDIVSNRAALVRDPAFTASSSQLYDFSEVSDLQVTVAGVRLLAQKSVFLPTARRALVVASDVAYGMARMYAIISNRDEEHFRIFRTHAAAVAWLTQTTP
jgi:hypothetical protein